jgi:hypothetical protein
VGGEGDDANPSLVDGDFAENQYSAGLRGFDANGRSG